MTVATERRLSIAEYLAYEDGSGDRFELVDGELFKMALGTGASHFCDEYNYSSRFAIKSQRMEKLYRGRNCDDPRRTTKSKRLFKRDCKDPIC